MGKQVKNVAVAALAAGALAVGAAVVADAASNNDSSGSRQGSTQRVPAPPRDSARAVHPGEELLSGDTAQKVKDAALEKVPGASVIRLETDAEGSPYEAHLRKADGSEVTAKVNKDFEVTKVEQGFGPGRGGHGGPPPGAPDGSGNGTSYGAPPAPTVTG